ncbi:unnamed protein product, partial [Prorocentrum cordatum]
GRGRPRKAGPVRARGAGPPAAEEGEPQGLLADYVQRAGGSGAVACAACGGGLLGGLLLLPGAPQVEFAGVRVVGWKAPVAGMAVGLYGIQLPEGDFWGDGCRRAARLVLARARRAPAPRGPAGGPPP